MTSATPATATLDSLLWPSSVNLSYGRDGLSYGTPSWHFCTSYDSVHRFVLKTLYCNEPATLCIMLQGTAPLSEYCIVMYLKHCGPYCSGTGTQYSYDRFSQSLFRASGGVWRPNATETIAVRLFFTFLCLALGTSEVFISPASVSRSVCLISNYFK